MGENIVKKSRMLNSEISYIISKMGHTDTLTIGDSGLPIPQEVQRIDLALEKGLPSFLDTLDCVLDELAVEEIILASEIVDLSNNLYKDILTRFDGIKITTVPHEEFKELTRLSKAVIRTGEFTAYANIILKSGVVF